MNTYLQVAMYPIFVVAYLTCNSVCADETTDFPEVEHVASLESPEKAQEETSLDSLMEFLGYDRDAAYIHRLHENAFNHIFGFSSDGSKVQLLDGSEWRVVGWDSYKVKKWVKDDDIFIKPSYSTNYFWLSNITLDEEVFVELTKFPSYASSFTYTIRNIDTVNRLVLLSDNTVWQMGYEWSLSSWKVGDRVFVGVKYVWHYDTYPQVLINVEIQNAPHCSAIFYGYPQY